jgi:hypothetical protein
MFCPKCGVKNLEDVKFCRACGANIGLVPQALAGSLTAEPKGEDKKVSKPEEPPTLEKGLENIFGSLAFFIIVLLAFTYLKGYFLFWIWFIIPALGHLGKGIGQVIRSRHEPHALAPAPHDALPAITPDALPAATADAPHGPATNEIGPPSVTENTTRSLGAARNAH